MRTERQVRVKIWQPQKKTNDAHPVLPLRRLPKQSPRLQAGWPQNAVMLQNRITNRGQIRSDPLQIAQNVQVNVAGLDRRLLTGHQALKANYAGQALQARLCNKNATIRSTKSILLSN